ncbi:MAG: hypothetical protein AAB646_01660 [Patescibacteria group bacterium]
MTTQVMIEKLNKEMGALKEDVQELKKFLFAPLRDSEGEYQKSFIKKMLIRAESRGPFYKFTGKDSFLKNVRAKK